MRRDIADRLRAAARTLALRDVERLGALEAGEAFRDHRRLRRQHRIVDFEIDFYATRLVRQRRNRLPRFARDERAAANFTYNQAAP